MPKNNDTSKVRTREHLANERTFLAWIRTSIGIMIFGFVVEKFTLFVRQIALFLGKEHLAENQNLAFHQEGWTSYFGVFLVALGGMIGLLSFFKFLLAEKQIEEEIYRPSWALIATLMLLVVASSIFLVIYLVK